MMKTKMALGAAAVMILMGTTTVLRAQVVMRTTNGGVYTEAQAERGRIAVVDSCTSCHGGDLTGADVAPGLVGPSFLGNWTGESIAALVSRIKVTMPLDRPGSLSSGAAADVVAFILKSNGYAAGETELPSDSQSQGAIKFEAPKS
jgi:quinoprotein glucose dehydrogenase